MKPLRIATLGMGFRAGLALALVYTLFGCATGTANRQQALSEKERAYIAATKPAPLVSCYAKIAREGKRNRVLNLMRLGVVALEKGYLEEAHEAFDQACDEIETVYADNRAAEKARSLWYEEGRKIFKGEPYERAMAFYYRGLCFIWDHDLQNARACFKAGMLQDAFAEEDQNRCDFALLLYLSGWCSQKLGDRQLAQQAFWELKKRLRPDAPIPGLDDNVLVIAETGTAPRKLSDGVGHYQLKFFRGKGFSEKSVRCAVDGGPETVTFYPIEDVYFQAASRGGRLVDCINEGKAQFKKSMYVAGSALSDAASTAMLASTVIDSASSQLQAVGGILGAVSVVSQLTSAHSKAAADTRTWDNLPDTVHVVSLKLPPGSHTVIFSFLDAGGNPVPGLSITRTVDVENSGYDVIWVRSRQ